MLGGGFNGLDRLSTIMNAPQGVETLIVEALDTQR